MRTFILIVLLLLTAGAAGAEGRIVSQSPYITSTLQYLGLSGSIVGVSRYDSLARPKTGGVKDPDREAIACLRPDYLFVSDWTSPEVLKKVTPRGTASVVLHGFGGMEEISDNIRVICKTLDIEGGNEKAAAFEREWREAASEVNGGGRRAIILSSCQGSPFSFGLNTYLYDLFTEAGFRVVEDHEGIRHVRPTELIGTLWELFEYTDPETVFVLDDGYGCPVRLPEGKYRIVNLDGKKFTSPSPRLLKGLEELKKVFNNP